MGFQAGAGALALKLPHMLLLAAILPHRLRVRPNALGLQCPVSWQYIASLPLLTLPPLGMRRSWKAALVNAVA